MAKESFASLGARREADRCDELLRAADDAAAGHRVTRTFRFTDIVGSTDLIGTIGDEAWNDVLSWHDDTLGAVIGSHGGTVVRTTGDGFFASFGDAGAALDGAIAIQRRLAEHRRRHGFAPQVRIGVHVAEATAVADDYAGLGVTRPRGSARWPREARSSQRRRRWLPRRRTSQPVTNARSRSRGSPTPSRWYRSDGEKRKTG